jgi:glutathione S-transferase
VINEYLEDAYPEPALRPPGALERTRMREWTLYIAEEPTWAVKVPWFEKNTRPELAGRYSPQEMEAIAEARPLVADWYARRRSRKAFRAAIPT